ncbi:AAA family ATPase, partial [Kineococcus sp. T90]
MATAAQVKALVQSHSLGDEARFRSVVLEVADSAARTGRTRYAEEVRALLDAARAPARAGAAEPARAPLAQPRGELAAGLGQG